MSFATITKDPLNKFNYLDDSMIMEMCGLIPLWASNPEYATVSLREALDMQYGFGLFAMKGGAVTDDGVFKYPDDPDLYPLLRIKRFGEVLYQYEFSIVAIVHNEGTLVTRMD